MVVVGVEEGRRGKDEDCFKAEVSVILDKLIVAAKKK